ncbi:MAG TPA: 23S rRNA (adenine(2030)-N(6))-methyltransferase RlmJ [Rhodocyclaceae bacterium]|nr:23S rRNA (adenine(2030)-N(6))-methyltransferase RlmJ [Rhodocyclaceae bacterium]
MLSYRHAFHAGNHADVLKHLILVHTSRHLGLKEAPFWYVDTHAGAGRYALESGHATKLAEFQNGIGKLWLRRDLPPAVAEYVELVQALNPDGKLRHYPGSPWLAWKTLRAQDRMRLFELHSTDVRLLQETFKGAGRQVTVTAGDGIAGLKAVLPPPPRRALVLIDPSYEVRSDYLDVKNGLQEALKRFATGTYAVWYPQLAKPESRQLPERLKSLPAKHWLHATLSVGKPPKDGFGMYGSGMFVINPPWTLADTLQEVLPWLVEVLGQEGGGKFTLETQGD